MFIEEVKPEKEPEVPAEPSSKPSEDQPQEKTPEEGAIESTPEPITEDPPLSKKDLENFGLDIDKKLNQIGFNFRKLKEDLKTKGNIDLDEEEGVLTEERVTTILEEKVKEATGPLQTQLSEVLRALKGKPATPAPASPGDPGQKPKQERFPFPEMSADDKAHAQEKGWVWDSEKGGFKVPVHTPAGEQQRYKHTPWPDPDATT